MDQHPHPHAGEHGEHPEKIDAAVLKVAGAVVLGMIMVILDITVVNVALPTFQTVFDVDSYATVAWTVTAYTLALATVIPITGWAADRFGTKRLYVTALALFAAGSVLCATAWNIQSLIGFRVIQGLGGGMLMPLGMTIMTKVAGPARMGRLMAILGVPMLLGPIAGPILGGWLIDSASWNWIFLINLPIGIAAIIYSMRVLPKDATEPSDKFDFVGMLLMSPGLALLLFGVSSIPGAGTVWDTKVLLTMGIGLVLVVSFVFYSFKPKNPLLDLRLFKNYSLAVSLVTMFLFGIAFFGSLLLVPTYFIVVRGESTLNTGLLISAQGIGAILTMPLAGALIDRIPVGRIVPVGMLAVFLGVLGLTQVGPDTSYVFLLACLFVLGLGMGGAMMPLFTAALRTLKPHEVARGSSLVNIIQQVASSAGAAIISMVYASRLKESPAVGAYQAMGQAQQDGQPPPSWAQDIAQQIGDSFEAVVKMDMSHAFAVAFWVSLALVAVTGGVSLLLPKKRSDEHIQDGRAQVEPVEVEHSQDERSQDERMQADNIREGQSQGSTS